MQQEQTVWSGTPSQVINLGTYVLCILFFWLVIPAFVLLWKWLVIRNTKYELTTERLRLRTGVFIKKTQDLELYRVRDYAIEQPFIFRFFSISNLALETADSSHPTLRIMAVPNAEVLLDDIRKHVEAMRQKRGVRTLDVG